jgi:flagellar motor switch protein FliN/FliY
MTPDLELPQLNDESADPRTSSDLRRLSAVPIELSVEVGRTRMTVGETLELREGSVITLDRMADEPVDVLVNGTPIARGEVVVIDEQFGLRLTHILAEDPAGAAAPAAPEPGAEYVGADSGAHPSRGRLSRAGAGQEPACKFPSSIREFAPIKGVTFPRSHSLDAVCFHDPPWCRCDRRRCPRVARGCVRGRVRHG